MSNKRIITVLLIGILVLVAVFVVAVRQENEPIGKPFVLGDTIPSGIKFETIGGATRSFQEFRGRVVLLNYWASWCAPCIREMPSIFKIYDKLKERGFAVIAINMDENAQQGENFLRNKVGPAPFEMYKGMDTRLQDLFPLEGLPFSALLDKEGKIVYAAPGEEDWSGEKMRKLIEGLL